MVEESDKKIKEKDIVGLKYFDQLGELLQQLHDVGCERDRAGNRSLHMDQYCMLILLYMFNPVVTSLRGLQQASELKKVQKKLGMARASLGSLSESVAVFDSERLKPIIETLGEKLVPIAADKRLKDVQHTLTLVDGSIVEALPRIAMASFRNAQAGSGKKMKWTLHTHFEVDRSVPTKMEVTPTAGGEHDERAVMDRMIESNRTYAMDRGYAKFELFNRIVDAGSSYVCRIRDNSVCTVLEERPLTDADRAARVLSDQIISLGSGASKEKPNHPVRLVVIEAKPHKSKGKPGTGSTGQNCDGFLRIATNLLDVPAEIIALLYFYRWTIELDIGSIKDSLNLGHVRCKSPEMVRTEFRTTFLAYNLIRLTAASAAFRSDQKPRSISFTSTCQFVLSGWGVYASGLISDKAFQRVCDQLLIRIAACRVGNRPGRLEPRVIKRRRHGYPLMQKPRHLLKAELRKHCT